ncbi:hypothetical protein PpBr36_07751 [Pyricularia pennisetigena]|uniref:hypothetical protein n=1 Tax=Pyricularia pennisetigena TaxID=1578925 RepID=UPI001154C9F7|nr:hypothetical protein PpBr36_07751 [Pyricularia pennisetigena]TLS25335.1 hypothetical protein PpBr36_07751 [Pyricularia pennisetigena]
MQRWRHTSLPLLRCTRPRLLGLRMTEYQSQIDSTLRRLSINGRNDNPQSKVQDVSPLLQIEHARISHTSGQTPEHVGDSLRLSRKSLPNLFSHSRKAAFPERRRLYRRHQSLRNARLLEGLGPSKDRLKRGFGLPRVFLTKPTGLPQFKSRRQFKAARRLYVISHYENTQIVRRIRPIKCSLRARRARLAFILWKRAVDQAKVWIYRLDLPASPKPPKIIGHLSLQKTIPEIREEWNRYVAGKRITSRKLGVILLCTLKTCPDLMPRLMEAIFPSTRSRLPHYMIEDILCMAILRWHKIVNGKMQNSTGLEQLTAIFRCLRALLRGRPVGHIHMRYDATTILFQNLAYNDLIPLYNICNKKRYLHATQSFLHLADRFAKMKTIEDKNRAIDILGNLVGDKRRTFNINSPASASICTSILKTDWPTKDTKPIQLAQRLLALGLQPNTFIYGTLVTLMWRSGELPTAWAIYDQMAQLVEIKDCSVYNTLMIGSLWAGDIMSLGRAFSLAIQRSLLEASDWGTFLTVLWAWPTPDHAYPDKIGIDRSAKFRLMLEVYSRVFYLEPLKYLIESPEKEDWETSTSLVDSMLSQGVDHLGSDFVPIIRDIPSPYRPDGLMKPTNHVLKIMTSAYVRGLSAPLKVLEFYIRFDKLLKDGDQLATGLTRKSTTIHNSIVKALSSFDMSRPVAYEVLRDMLEAHGTTASAQRNRSLIKGNHKNGYAAHQHERPTSCLPRPNRETFNMLINALMFDGQIEEAENMLQMMRDQGISLDIVTWNTLVRGYARMQDVDGTVRSLQRMEQEGFQSNDRTISAFNRLSVANRKLALSKMELVIEENRKTQISGDYSTTVSSNGEVEASEEVVDELQREIEHISSVEAKRGSIGNERLRRGWLTGIGNNATPIGQCSNGFGDRSTPNSFSTRAGLDNDVTCPRTEKVIGWATLAVKFSSSSSSEFH